jgi:hypothetical protein
MACFYRGRMTPQSRNKKKNRQRVPLVGGEPARRILEIVRGFPLSVSYSGGVRVEVTVEGADREMFERAYNWIEMEFLERESRCANRAAHPTVDATEYQWMILNELVSWAKFALDDNDFEALWAPRPLRKQFGLGLPSEAVDHHHHRRP